MWIESDVYGFQSAIKKFGLDRWKKNCVKATEGFQHVLIQLYGGGSSSVVTLPSSTQQAKLNIEISSPVCKGNKTEEA